MSLVAKVLDPSLRGFADDDLDAVVAGLGGGVFLAAADDFAVGGYVIEPVLARSEKGLEALRLAVGFDALDAVFATGFAGVAFAGLDDFAVVGAQVVSSGLTPPDPSKIENYGHLIIQAVVALVTIWATVRKALQKPEEVVKVPVEVVPLEKAGNGGGLGYENGAQ